MKKIFNQKFGPENNPKLDHAVLKSIANERKLKHSNSRWFAWTIGATAALSITFCTLNLRTNIDPTREAYIEAVLEIQKSFDENADLEISNDAFDLTGIATDEI